MDYCPGDQAGRREDIAMGGQPPGRPASWPARSHHAAWIAERGTHGAGAVESADGRGIGAWRRRPARAWTSSVLCGGGAPVTRTPPAISRRGPARSPSAADSGRDAGNGRDAHNPAGHRRAGHKRAAHNPAAVHSPAAAHNQGQDQAQARNPARPARAAVECAAAAWRRAGFPSSTRPRTVFPAHRGRGRFRGIRCTDRPLRRCARTFASRRDTSDRSSASH